MFATGVTMGLAEWIIEIFCNGRLSSKLIHEAEPQLRPVVITLFIYIVFPSFRMSVRLSLSPLNS